MSSLRLVSYHRGVLFIVLYLFGSATCGPNLTATQETEQVQPCVMDICITKDCVRTAATLIEAMDISVDPCEDFYQFSCGRFIQEHPIPDDAPGVNTFLQFRSYYRRQSRDLIEDINAFGEPDIVARTQEAYHVCLNTTYQVEKELDAFKSFVNDILGGWPFAEGIKWKPRWTKEEFLGRIQRLGLPYGFGEFIFGPGIKDVKEKHIWMLHGIEPERFYSVRSALGASVDPATAFMKLVSSLGEKLRPPGAKVASMDQYDLIFLPGKIAKLQEEYELLEHALNTEELTLKEMNELAEGRVDWLKILNTKFENVHSFQETDVIMTDREYVKRVSKFVAYTSYRSIANYVVGKVLFQLLPHAGPGIEELFDEFIQSLTPMYEHRTRGTKCVDWLQQAYMFSLTRLFVRKHVDPRAKNMVTEMLELIREAYKKTIKESPWLDEETRQNAINKANLMKQFVSYPEFILDDQQLEEHYDYIPSVNPIHFHNFIDTQVNESIKAMKVFLKPGSLEIHKWTQNPLQINAFYDPSSNSIWFPSGILQLPFFEATRPAAVNYGMIGSTIGHEMGHGFDNSGSRFDEYGQFHQWWTNDTKAKYSERTECYVNQYDQFCPEMLQGGENDTKICTDGSNTLGDNIADNEGLKVSFRAYKEWVKKHGKEKRLPGLEEFTPEQIFFISYGYIWCENIPPENWSPIYGRNDHSSGRYRTVGVLQNMDEFANVFNCSVGPMSRENKCQLWS